MFNIGLSLFLTGLFLGAGPCLVSCGPFLVSFIAGNKKDFKDSLRIWFVFSISRIFAYLVLGFLVGLLSQMIISKIYETLLAKYLLILGGIFVLLIGVLMIFNKLPQMRLYNCLKENLISKDKISTAIFGLIVGFLPCAPLLGVLAYVALISKSILKGVFYCFSFGLGTIVSPLILMVICASYISKLLGSQKRIYNIFRKICAAIIIFLGFQLLRSGLNI